MRWDSWDQSTHEQLTLGWENGGWTADGLVAGPDIHYVIRLDEQWQMRQFLLFRDLDEPDLWLVTDGTGRWAEMNGERRPELDGCVLIDLTCTPFTTGLALRAVADMDVGSVATIDTIGVDPETLAVVHTRTIVERPSADGWRVAGADLTTDADWLVEDHHGHFRRVG